MKEANRDFIYFLCVSCIYTSTSILIEKQYDVNTNCLQLLRVLLLSITAQDLTLTSVSTM